MGRLGTLLVVLSLVCFGAAVGLIAFALLHGGATAGVFLIFPFVAGSSPSLGGGVLLLVVGFFTLFFGLAASASEGGTGPEPEESAGEGSLTRGSSPAAAARGAGTGRPQPRVSYGGFLLIGPVPVVFGNREGWAPYLVAMAVVALLAILVFALLQVG